MSEEWERLTAREKAVAGKLLEGATNSEIAQELNMKTRTVKAYFGRMFTRYGITSGVKRIKLAVLLYHSRGVYP